MKIIGGKDYYDGVTGFDTDDRMTFIRHNFNDAKARDEAQVYPLNDLLLYGDTKIKQTLRWDREGSGLSTIRVLFCGVLYRGLYRDDVQVNPETLHVTRTIHSFWDEASLREELKRQECVLEDNDRAYWYKFSNPGAKRVTNSTIGEFFKPQELSKDVQDMLRADRVVHSIGMGRKQGKKKEYRLWYDNTDGLKNIGFARVIDPWQAYQQIDMWVGSELARDEDNMVKLDDKELIQKHGFDQKSFRNTHHAGKPRSRT